MHVLYTISFYIYISVLSDVYNCPILSFVIAIEERELFS